MTWRKRGLTLKVGRLSLQCCYGFGGRDRWLLVDRNTIVRAWSAPRWLSFMRDHGRLRGGC
jgi:hypothetical protein